MREFARVLKPGGFGFITTPNQHSWASKASFLLRGEHRFFAAPSYPAHITPLLKCDLLRMLAENNLAFLHWFYSNEDNLPLLHWRIKLPGAPFSACIGVLFRKPEHPQVSRQASDS
jgi:hypothetical protein